MSSTYSEVNDLLTGNIPLPLSADPQRYVDDAADEVDSVIGFRYLTPIDMTDGGPVARPARLLLKRTANFLASGRILLSVAAGSEDKQMHAYGLYLVQQAMAILKQIAEGDIMLPGAPGDGETTPIQGGPLIYNKDAESNVEAFYDRVLAPTVPGERVRVWPGVFI